MASLSTEPTYPVPGRKMRVVFALTESGTDYLRVWVTDAPQGSELKKELDDSGKARSQVFEGDGNSAWEFAPDRGGCYRLTVQEYTRGASTHGGAYEDDPNAAPSETKVGSESSLTLYVGQKLVSQLGVGGDVADLVLYVFDSTIRATTLEIQGEVSPRIENPSSDRARSAMVDSSVQTNLAALDGDVVATAIGTVSTIASDIVTNFNSHLDQASVHQNDDEDNGVNPGFGSAVTPETMPRVLTETLTKMRRHMLNDAGSGPGTVNDGADPPVLTPYHDVGGAKFDWTNLPLFVSVGDTASSYRALADIWRAYEAHRVSTTVHDAADSTNDLAALPALLTVHRYFFAALAALTPTVPDTQSTGAQLLITQTGAKES